MHLSEVAAGHERKEPWVLARDPVQHKLELPSICLFFKCLWLSFKRSWGKMAGKWLTCGITVCVPDQKVKEFNSSVWVRQDFQHLKRAPYPLSCGGKCLYFCSRDCILLFLRFVQIHVMHSKATACRGPGQYCTCMTAWLYIVLHIHRDMHTR